MIEAIGNFLLIVSAIINLEVVVKYHRITEGAWRQTVMGRHVMIFMAAIGLVLVLASARVVSVTWMEYRDPVWFQVLRVATYLVIPAIFLWRRHLIVKAHQAFVQAEIEKADQ